MPRPKKNKSAALVPDDPPTPSVQILSELAAARAPPAMPKKRAVLFEESDSDAEDDDNSGFQSAQQSPAVGRGEQAFDINTEYAKRFEHNKKREERMKLEEKYGNSPLGKHAREEDEDESSSSDDEDETAVLATEQLDKEWMATLNAIRSKDPKVYDAKTTFYTPVDEADEPEKKKEDKPLLLRDYHRERLLSGKAVADDDDDDKPQGKTFAQEQDELQRSLVSSMHAAADGDDEEGNDDFLVAKPRKEVDESKAFDLPDPKTADPKNPAAFLDAFMQSRAWVKTSNYPTLESDDSEEEAAAEEFEVKNRMRFEDPDAAERANFGGFDRKLVAEQSVRREDVSSRKKARDEKRKRKELEKEQREMEKNRLRKLRTEELLEKFKKIQDAAGFDEDDEVEAEVLEKLLEGDWSDEEWETWVGERFGEKYYEKDAGKPKFDDDIDIKDIIPDFDDEEIKEDEEDDGGEEEEGHGVDEDEEMEDADEAIVPKNRKDVVKEKRDKKQKEKALRRKLERFVEDNVDLDASLPAANDKHSGFRYRDVSPESMGLTTLDILAAQDAELNSFIGLKHYATFRDPDKKKRDKKKYGKKKRLREWRKEAFGDEKGVEMPKDWKPEGIVRKGETEGTVEEGGAEKKKKRRRKNKSGDAVKV